MQPTRFPPRGTPAWFRIFEQQLLVERVDNERQWRLLRQMEGLLTGLDPVIDIVDLRFSTTSTTTTDCGDCDALCFQSTIPLAITPGCESSTDVELTLHKITGCAWNGSNTTSGSPQISAATLQIISGTWGFAINADCGPFTGGDAFYSTAFDESCDTVVLSYVSDSSVGVTWPSTITFTKITCP